jgi:hypothetical protein
MKYLSVLFALFFSLLTVNVKAQSKPLSNEETISLLCHKWQAIEIRGGGKKMPIPPNGDYMLLKSDFSYEENQDGTIGKGSWKYVAATKKIIFSSGNEYTVKSITTTGMELSFTMEGVSSVIVYKHFSK